MPNDFSGLAVECSEDIWISSNFAVLLSGQVHPLRLMDDMIVFTMFGAR